MQAFYPLKFKPSAPKASRPGSTSIFPCPWRRQSACKPAKKSSGNCWIALNYTWYENSYLSSKPLKGQAKPTKLLCRPPENRLPKTNGAAAPTQVAPDPPVRENLTHDFLSAYEILGLGGCFRDFAARLADSPLLQSFCRVGQLDRVKVPAKSTLQRYATWLPDEDELREVINGLLRKAGQRLPMANRCWNWRSPWI